jgi:bifunctional non-homologous end joining protein LigD
VLDAEMVSSEDPNLYEFLKDRTTLQKTQLIVFDVLMENGEDLRDKPLLRRKHFVSQISGTHRIRPIWFELATSQDDVWKQYNRATGPAKFEGIVVKPVDSIYTDGAWCKIKKTVTHDVVVLAIKKTGAFLRDGGHPVDARCFLIGFVDETGKTVRYGNVSSGFGRVDTDLLELTGEQDSEYVYVKPNLVIEIMAHSLLVTQKFREPRILRMRTDKRAIDCKIPDGS